MSLRKIVLNYMLRPVQTWATRRGAEVRVQRKEKDKGGWREAEMKEQRWRNNHKARHSQEGVGGQRGLRVLTPSLGFTPLQSLEATNQIVDHCSFIRERKSPKTSKKLPEQLTAS